jgi:SAM-dependent methyltransferase
MPTAEELRKFYACDYRLEYKSVISPKAKHVWRASRAALERINFLQLRLSKPKGPIFDIGAGAGEFLYLCRRLGFGLAEGIEPNDGYCRYGQQELSVDIKQAELCDVQGEYPIVTLFHVLEHLLEPLNVFQHLYGLVSDGGYLFIEVPGIESPFQSPNNTFFKAHTLYFSRATLISCASGFFVPELVDDRTANLRVLFRKRTSPVTIKLPSAESVERTRNRLRAKTWTEYLVNGGGLIKPVRKLTDLYWELRVRKWPGVRILDEIAERQGND